jgi:CHAT domain-containing protein
VRVWREGKRLDLAVPPGPVGVQVSREGPAEALRTWRTLSGLTRGSRGETFAPLPGTRREVESIARLFRDKEVLLGSEASEQQLDRLRSAGRLRAFRFLHFATHGVPDDQSAMRSALILSQDKLPDPLGQVLAGKEVCDGRLTAEEMLRDWRLDAELVTLSACQTGLGKYSGGEGYLGFSQALFRAGARGLVVTLWQVDDRATALLMTRFYENMLGTPDEGAAPRPKAEALSEAKAWLSALSAEEVARLAADLPRGLPNGTRGVRRERDNLKAPDAPRPFAHPYYWSAFILIGDPR